MKIFVLALLIASPSAFSQEGTSPYPKTRKENLYETRFGALIHDPYRWMENVHDPDLYTWLADEAALTNSELSGPLTDELSQEFMLLNSKQNLHANALLEDEFDGESKEFFHNLKSRQRDDHGITSSSGRYTVTLRRDSGSDLGLLVIFDTKEQKLLPDILLSKTQNVIWDDGEKSFVYCTSVDGRTQGATGIIRRHYLGQPQTEDQILFQSSHSSQAMELAEVDGQLIVFQAGRDAYNIGVFDSQSGKISWKLRSKSMPEPFALDDGELLMISDDSTPMGEILRVNLTSWDTKVVIAARQYPIDSAIQDGDEILVSYVKDGSESELIAYDLDKGSSRQVKLPGSGSVNLYLGARAIRYSTYDAPSSQWSYSAESATLQQVGTSFPSPVELVSEKITYLAQNGQQIPIWLVRKKGTPLNSDTPVYLYGYGGFRINILPAFDRNYLPFLSRGGMVAIVTLPGGNEYGRDWHEQGILYKKKNVFDDFAAAARRLFELKYTNPEKIAIGGVSNGGLLVGATANLFPDLFRVAVPEVGVLDLTRFQIFTGGASWMHDYGDMRIRSEFLNQLALSPYHNLARRQYPATLVMTADQDDRVVPSHSYKYLARLQEYQIGNRPVILHVRKGGSHSTRSGPEDEVIKAQVYKWSFIMQELGM